MSLETTIEEETYSKGDDKRLRLRHLFISLLVVFLVTSFSNKVALAEESDVYQLYQTSEEVTLEQGITILKGTYLYGQQVEDNIEVQFSNTSVMIPLSSVTSIEPSEDAPEFVISSSNNESIQIPTNTKAFSVTSDVESLLFHNDVVYPVHMDAESTTIILGNTYFVMKDDLVSSNEKDVTTDPVEEKVGKETNEAKPKEEINKVTKPNNESKISSNLNKTTSLNKSTSTQQVDWKSVTHFKALVDLPVYDNRTGKLVKVGELKKGQVYPRVSDYGNWHRIQFGNIYGYVRKADTIPANKSSIKNENNNQYTNQSNSFITLKNVTVYDNTSGSLVPFGVIDKGISFPIATDYGNWWRVIYSDRVGYVRKSEVEVDFTKSDKYFKANENLPVYDNRTGKLVKVGELVKGQVYPRVSDYGNWHRIQFGNIYGYVRKSGTTLATGKEIKNINKNYKNQSRTLKTLTNVTVYDNTSGSLVPFGIIDKGISFPIATDYGNWWRVIYSDRVGYVRKSEVEVDFTKSDKYFKANENLPVYDNRTGQLVKVGELVKGQVYPRVSDYGNWHRIQFGNIYGYVRKSGTTLATGKEIKNINNGYGYSRSYIIPKQTTTVYDNTSGKLVSFGTIDKGVKFSLASDYEYGNWWRVIYADRIGYIRKSEVDATILPEVKIFIDPGHGGSDPGARSGNVYEKTLTLDIAKRIEEYLKQYDGVEIKLTRTSDRYLSLPERSKMANDWGADYFVSVHINAGGGTGFESYIYNNPTKDEIDKQAIIHDHIASNIKNDGVRDRGKKRANYHVIRETNMSAILMEYLFIDTTADRNKLLDASFRDKLARLTAEGIAKAFGLQKK